MSNADAQSDASAVPVPRWVAAIELALILLLFSCQAAWPPPDPNEAHYLGKARHYWNPDWAPHDFFFESADTHQVFYLALGWFTRWLPLVAFAWLGRLVTWILLAWTWRRLCYAVLPRPWWCVLGALIFLTSNVSAHMAGEWVVGGFEAKGLAYALVFAALAALVRDRWNTAWLLLGAASALHVLVGGWSVVAAGCCWLAIGDRRPPLRSMTGGLAGGLLLALPGLVPALALNWGVPADVVSEANMIYVFRRLPHHLTPRGLPAWFIGRHLLLIVVWLALCRLTPSDPGQRRLRAWVAGAVAISAAGFLISAITWSHPSVAAALLRFYWFRLSDVAVPVGVALAAVVGSFRSRHSLRWAAGWIVLSLGLPAVNLRDYAVAHLPLEVPRADNPSRVVDYGDWLDVTAWVRRHTPGDAVFLTPRLSQTFGWYSGRSQVATWKDIPQDARAIVEWRRRLLDIHATRDPAAGSFWHASLAELSVGRLLELGSRYGAGYVLTESEPPLALPLLHKNNSYAVYSLSRRSAAVPPRQAP